MGETAAENTFFESGGNDASAVIAENKDLVKEAPRETKVEVTPKEAAVTTGAETKTEVTETKTPAEIAAANAEATKARQRLLADLGAVPLEALQEARQEAKTLKQQQAELAAWKQQVEPLLAQLKPQKTGNPYDPNAQPNEYANYEWEAQKREVAELKQARERDAQQQLAAQRTQQILGWADTQRQSFEKATPDFKDALDFAVESRSNELKAIGMNDMEISQAVEASKAEIIMLAANRTMQGTPTNPAQLIYEFAKARGYKGKEAPDKALTAA